MVTYETMGVIVTTIVLCAFVIAFYYIMLKRTRIFNFIPLIIDEGELKTNQLNSKEVK